MNINDVFVLVNYIANKEQSGNTFTPSQFNLLARVCQLEFISNRIGNIKNLKPNDVPPFGYKSSRKVDEDLRPLVYGPINIPILSNGNFNYPDGYMWPDAIHKTDFSQIYEVDSDQYPFIKKSTVIPPSTDYPIVIYRSPYGFIDPYNISQFSMSYVKVPDIPIWGYDEPQPGVLVYNPSKSTDFKVNPYLNAHLEICLLILQKSGVNLQMADIVQYAMAKEDSTG
jgi:hypothetical protein